MLIFNGERFEAVPYRIEVHRVGNTKRTARGRLSLPGSAITVAIGAFDSGQAELELDSGHVVQIVPSRMAMQSGSRTLEFVVNGAVPGFGP